MVVYWQPSRPVKCNRRLCGAVAHIAPKGNRRVVIECTKCQHFERGDTELEVEQSWHDWLKDRGE